MASLEPGHRTAQQGLLDGGGGAENRPRRHQVLTPRAHTCHLTWREGLYRGDDVKDIGMGGRLSWIDWMGH